MIQDRFSSYSDLVVELKEGKDFELVSTDRNSPVAIIAPHGGKIEFMTTKIARAIADDDFNFYSFLGLKTRPHHEIHITSHKFDEPRCLKTISKCRLVVTIHGRRDSGDRQRIFVGGLDKRLKKSIADELKKSGFACRLSGHRFRATQPKNICNRGSTKKGCQLELPATLRRALGRNKKQLKEFSVSVSRAIKARL